MRKKHKLRIVEKRLANDKLYYFPQHYVPWWNRHSVGFGWKNLSVVDFKGYTNFEGDKGLELARRIIEEERSKQVVAERVVE